MDLTLVERQIVLSYRILDGVMLRIKCLDQHAARQIATERLRALGRPELRTNAELSGSLLESAAAPVGSGLALLRDAAEAMRLSARGYHRVLKVARTIADLDGAEAIGRPHLAEALAYRALNDKIAIAA